jgi:hypothetical protein
LDELIEILSNLRENPSSNNVYTFFLSKNYQIQCGHKNYYNTNYDELRIYYSNSDDQWSPTPKGITFNPQKTHEIILALQSIKNDEN